MSALTATNTLALLWGLGWLGFSPGFARAHDVDSLREIAAIGSRSSLRDEIRYWQRVICTAPDTGPIERVLENLQEDYARVSAGRRYPDVPCVPPKQT